VNDFVKIFLGLSALVVAFLFGRNYGEKGYRESEEYKAIIKSNEELSFAKNELENLKVKFQNIADGAGTKKSDELLTQIMNIFLADLGLRIENKNAFIKQNEKPVPTIPTSIAAPVVALQPAPVQKTKSENSGWSKARINKFKASEWMIVNSAAGAGTLRALEKTQIKNMNSFLTGSTFGKSEECADFLGSYKGKVNDINNKYLGSFEFELKTGVVNSQEQYYGKIAWNNNGSSSSEKIGNNCGRTLNDIRARILSLGMDKYIQIYKLSSPEVIAGNFYEVLPNGTTKIIGSFALPRVDKF
jgi:hypothetical protein